MAPLTSRPKEQEDLAAAAAAAGAPVIALADRLSALPSDVLPQILSCLPAHEAVRTCVLARTWRNLWKEKRIFPRRLLLTATAADPAVRQEIPGFIDRLLDLRLHEIKDAPLDNCEIIFRWYYDEEIPSLSSWIRRALECQIQALRVHMWRQLDRCYPYFLYNFLTSSKPLASQNLTRLELAGIEFKFMDGCTPDLSCCPALEDMELVDCLFSNTVMTSPSLKRLTFRRCKFFDCSRIRVPRVVSLWLEDLTGRGPQLESMPELEVAYVYISHYYDGSDNESSSSDPGVTDDDDSELDSGDDDGADSENSVVLASDNGESDSSDDAEADTGKYLFLDGLSEARKLTLISEDNTYVIRNDLRWCPTFNKLKTLVLNDHWCKPVDCSSLACILEHTPVLEKLTIEFTQQIKCNYKVEMNGHRHATEESTMISQYLKIVEVKCETLDETVLNVLNFMGTLDISFQFSVRQGSHLKDQISHQ